MSALNPARRFLKAVNKLQNYFKNPLNAMHLHSNSFEKGDPRFTKMKNGGWTWKRSDGRMQTCTWRIAPGTYCGRGKPLYLMDDLKTFRRKSETEKILFEYKGYEFVWAWTAWFGPTETFWGVRPSEYIYIIREKNTGKILAQEQFKTKLLDEWQFISTGFRPMPKPRKPSKKSKPSLNPPLEGADNLYLVVITNGCYYPELRNCYKALHGTLCAGAQPDDIWETFLPTVAKAMHGSSVNVRTRNERQITRQVALRIAHRYYQEWCVNPRDFS